MGLFRPGPDSSPAWGLARHQAARSRCPVPLPGPAARPHCPVPVPGLGALPRFTAWAGLSCLLSWGDRSDPGDV
ncbi:MAG TPA: hypothetical protein VJ347_23200 [Streptosporangiaceae bacterium]|nr:hypothetical protein [Streptosporangiaceae bacterium]